ncbi:hypothetical protein C8J42_1181 [Sphingomonas sp. PP-CE-1A-559]|nr:hypothetical protein C8J42_1181 [Sphingomonas sp. PP-CE-1A-559]
MNTGLLKIYILMVFSVLYWSFACWVTGTNEPWDADAYWRSWYPASLCLAGIAGLMFKGRGWMAGAILTFAQLPVMWMNTATGPLLPAGLMVLCLLAMPAVAISASSGWLAVRLRSR